MLLTCASVCSFSCHCTPGWCVGQLTASIGVWSIDVSFEWSKICQICSFKPMFFKEIRPRWCLIKVCLLTFTTSYVLACIWMRLAGHSSKSCRRIASEFKSESGEKEALTRKNKLSEKRTKFEDLFWGQLSGPRYIATWFARRAKEELRSALVSIRPLSLWLPCFVLCLDVSSHLVQFTS